MISPARLEAFRAIRFFRQNKSTLREPHCIREEDTRLAAGISQGVLQNERFLDSCITEFLSSGLNKLHPKVLDILRLSAFQILFLDRVPVSAAVNDAVSLCRKEKCPYAAGMVNAVLRRMAGQKEWLLQKDFPPAVRYSLPDWLAERLLKEYSPDFIRGFLISNQSLPELRIQINTCQITLQNYLSLLQKQEISPIEINSDLNSVLLKRCDVTTLPGYREGCFYVQDDAARHSVKLAAIKPGMKVLDVCAAPGGKSIAAFLDGGDVLSCDLKENRLIICEENYKRLHFPILTQQMDAAVFHPDFQDSFDVVIADVPCSGTGVIRKHPEIRFKREEELSELISLQKSILQNVSKYVKPGGKLLYSTCSVLKDENEKQIEWFLSENHQYNNITDLETENSYSGGYYRSWPQMGGNDGFFAAVLRRGS